MTVVSSKEFVKDEDKYLDMAMNGQVFIQRGDCMFHIICSNPVRPVAKKSFEEAVAECNGVSVDEFIHELRKRVKERYKNAKG